MLRPEPSERVGAAEALGTPFLRLRPASEMAAAAEAAETADGDDGDDYISLVEEAESCVLDDLYEERAGGATGGVAGGAATGTPALVSVTFRMNRPLGLKFEELGGDDGGAVMVAGIVPGSQAAALGTITRGDVVRSVGGASLPDGPTGFERVARLIRRQPEGAQTVRIELSRADVGRKRARLHAVSSGSLIGHDSLGLRVAYGRELSSNACTALVSARSSCPA